MRLNQVRTILWKDLRLEARNLPELGGAVVFSVASSSVLGFAVNRLSPEDPLPLIGAGIALIAVFLAVFTSIMTIVREEDLGTLDGVRLTPVRPTTFFAAKLLLSVTLMEGLIGISLAAVAVLSGEAIGDLPYLFSMSAAAGLYLSAVSALSSAMAVYLRARGILLPTMILVLSLPAVQEILAFLSVGGRSGIVALALTGAFFSLLASALAGYVLEV